jgi:hypothetical protein
MQGQARTDTAAKKMSKATWASEEDNNDSVGEHQVSNHEDERTLEKELCS